MDHRLTRRGVLGAIGGTAAVGVAGGLVAAQESGDGETGETRDDYWRVTEESAATVVAEDTAEGVVSGGDVVIGRGVQVDGPVEAAGHVLVGEGSTISGVIEAGGAVVTDFVVDVDGGIAAGDDVILGVDIVPAQQASAAGDLRRVADLPMEGGVSVGDSVTTTGGDVLVGPDGVIEGSVTADGDDAEQTGGEQSGPPTVVLGSWVEVEGDLTSAGDAVLGPDSSVGGTVTADGTVVFADGATFGGIEADRIDQGPEADVWPEDEDGSDGGDGGGEEGPSAA